MSDDVIEIGSSSEADPDATQPDTSSFSRRDILTPFIQSTVSALGGFETNGQGEKRYRPGDSCLGCLRDLKRFWRKDDTDDERTVARIFWETRVLANDLVPILLETAGRGAVEDKRAIVCGMCQLIINYY